MLPQEIKEILERGDYRIEKDKLKRFNAIDDAWNEITSDNKGMVRVKNIKGTMEMVSISQFIPTSVFDVKAIKRQIKEIEEHPEKAKEFNAKDLLNDYDKLKKNPIKKIADKKQGQIRADQIPQLRKLLLEGKSKNSIAKELGIPRPTIVYYANRIKKGEPLRYEDKPTNKTK